ncbi:MAG: hypothetical protein JXB88_08545 [Spirochaetales bacterium]|nr:hypothetical protein [Spirochaetales bacterium]
MGSLLCSVLLLWNVFYGCTTVSEQDKQEWTENQGNKYDEYLDTGTIEEDEPDEYTLIDEEYDIIFNEIEMVIEKLNNIIRKKEYHIWLSYLTEDYKEKKGNREYLKELSEMPVIKSRNIILSSLKDYFFYVVVPSRYNAKLDKISFIDKTHVKAYMYMNNEFIILYYLEKQDDEWKIGIW